MAEGAVLSDYRINIQGYKEGAEKRDNSTKTHKGSIASTSRHILHLNHMVVG